MKQYPDSCWPTVEHEFLLKACLLKGNDAVNAWETWKDRVDFTEIDPASRNLLPLLWKNLVEHKIDDPLMQYMKGFYKLTWYKNTTLIKHVSSLVNTFNDLGIETVLLKGLALMALYYKDSGVRPMGDADILVRSENISMAMVTVIKNGWKKTQKLPMLSDFQIDTNQSHGLSIINKDNISIDLHWHLLHERCTKKNDELFWPEVNKFQYQGIQSNSLCPTDQLFHIMIHGLQWSETRPIRWITDAVMILRDPDTAIDWHRFIWLSEKSGLNYQIKHALSYLNQLLPQSIPTSTIETIEAIPVRDDEKREYRHKTNGLRRKPFHHLIDLWYRSQRYSVNSSASQVSNFIDFLCRRWNLSSSWKLAPYMLMKVIQRVKAKPLIINK